MYSSKTSNSSFITLLLTVLDRADVYNSYQGCSTEDYFFCNEAGWKSTAKMFDILHAHNLHCHFLSFPPPECIKLQIFVLRLTEKFSILDLIFVLLFFSNGKNKVLHCLEILYITWGDWSNIYAYVLCWSRNRLMQMSWEHEHNYICLLWST